jgi:hypothetical protein
MRRLISPSPLKSSRVKATKASTLVPLRSPLTPPNLHGRFVCELSDLLYYPIGQVVLLFGSTEYSANKYTNP